MSEPVVIALIRDGQRRVYGDRWSAAFLHREVIWGPEDFLAWASGLDELEDWEDCGAGVAVDFDNKKMTWTGGDSFFEIPRASAVYDRLLRAAWPDYEIVTTLNIDDIARASGVEEQALIEREHNVDFGWRPTTIREATEDFDNEEELDDWEDSHPEDEEAEVGAWVALVDEEGVVRHRRMTMLPKNLLRNRGQALQQLRELPAAAAPPERSVSEAMWIDIPRKTIGVWGHVSMHREFLEMQSAWPGWTVVWAENGYDDQCAVCGPIGAPMSDAEALGTMLPTVLSTVRFDIGTMMNAIGGEAKKTGMKAAGCLFLLVCFPMLIFGLVTGRWQAVGISVVVTLVLFIVGFKLIEWRIRRSWAPMFQDDPAARGPQQAPEPCGPQEESARRARIDSLLSAAGFPPLREVEPHFSKDDELELLG